MIVVTGGAGFIGSNLVAALEARGHHDVVVVDRLGTDERWRNVAKRELADIVAPEGMFRFLERYRAAIDVVFHMGANSSTTERDMDRLIAENVRPSLDLWEWCAHHGKRLIYASSAATYGDGRQGFDDDASPEALARLRPLNGYGWSKHFVDRRIARLVREGRPQPRQWAGLKFFNVYGPNEFHKGSMRSVVVQVFERAAAGEPARLFRSHRSDYADGGQLRDFVWVGDCVEVMLWLMDHPGVSGLFNMGSARARSFDDLARAVFEALGHRPELVYVDMPEAIRERYQYFTEAPMERLRAAGWNGQATPLEEGVRRYVVDHLAREDPYL